MNMNRLSWDDLRVFLAVARAGNLSRAGRVLGMDHATVGRRISALEFALETPVFERDRQGYRLNAQGRDMLLHVEAVEANVLTLGDVLNGAQPGLTGPVRVATMEGIASLYLSEQFVEFKRRQPGITVELVTSATDVRISHREADVFIGFFEPRGANLQIQRIGRFTLHLYAHPDYLAQAGTPNSADDLRQHRFVGYIDELIQLDAVRWLDDAIANPPLAFHSTSMIAQMFAAAAGSGLVLLPEFAGAGRFGLQRLLAQEVEVRRDLWLSVHHDLRYAPRIKAVVGFLQQLFASDPLYAY